MYNAMKRIYASTHNEAYLTKAVSRGWITEEEKAQIMQEVDDAEN